MSTKTVSPLRWQKRLNVLVKGARATGAQRKKAIVAVARRLAVDLVCTPDAAPPPGSAQLFNCFEFEENSFGTWRVSGI